MSEFFLHLFNLSVSATWLIAAVIIIRLALKKFAPRWTVCLLWAVVGLRLIIPFSIESELSLIPSVQTLNPDAIYTSESVSDFVSEDISETVSTEDISEDRADSSANEPIIIPPIANIDKPDPEVSSGVTDQPQATPDKNTPENKIPDVIPDKDYIQSGIKPVDDRLNGAISSAVTENPKKNPIKTFTNVGCIVWIVGMAVMGIYAAVNYLLLKRRVSESVPEENNVRRSENVGSPFILGIIKPKIYLPFGLSSETEHHIIAHERAHIKRLDHLIKPFGYMLLTVYWFNPLVWIAYILLCRDIETACDEKVVEKMNAEARKAYASALLECGIKRSVIAACPVAFGEIGVKQRVKNALTYKKPMFWIIIVALVITVALAVFFLTGPLSGDGNESSANSESSDVSENSDEFSDEVSEIEYVYDATPRNIDFVTKYYLGNYTYRTEAEIINGDCDTVPDVINGIESRDEVIKRLEQCGDSGSANHDIIEALKKLDEKYFKENILLINDFTYGNLDIRRNVQRVHVDEKGVTITYRYAAPNEVALPVVNYCIVTTELRLSDVYGHKDFFAVAEDMNYDSSVEDFDCQYSCYRGFITVYSSLGLDTVTAETIATYGELRQILGNCTSSALKADSEKYGEKFFRNNALILIYVESASGGNVYLPEKAVTFGENAPEINVKRDLSGKDNRKAGHIFIAEVDSAKVFGSFRLTANVENASIDAPLNGRLLLTVTKKEGKDRFFGRDETGIIYQVICNDNSKINENSLVSVVYSRLTELEAENDDAVPIYELTAVTVTPFEGKIPDFGNDGKVSARNNAMSSLNSFADISKTEEEKIISLIKNGKWESGISDADCDWVFTVEGDTLYYYSYRGKFIDREGKRTLNLSTDDKNTLNAFLADEELTYVYHGDITAATEYRGEEIYARISNADKEAILELLNRADWRYEDEPVYPNITITVGGRTIEYNSHTSKLYDPVFRKVYRYPYEKDILNSYFQFLSPDGVWRPTSEKLRVDRQLMLSESFKGRAFDYNKLIAMSSDEIAEKIFAPAAEYYEIFSGLGNVKTSDKYIYFWDTDNMTFVKMYEVTDKRFPDYYTLVAKMRKYFDSLLTYEIFDVGPFMEYNGKLYYNEGVRGGVIDYYKSEYTIKSHNAGPQSAAVVYSVTSAYFKYEEDRIAFEKDPTVVIPDERLEFKTVEFRFNGWEGYWSFRNFELPY